ncbi:MAG: CDP-diacylglycerol--serine O-phosphatidyltransferase [Bacteroidales bacterium]|nr:CDP-diacylglycerol--serine O-phosphatidyltransferase [Bacteroidales bacterium]
MKRSIPNLITLGNLLCGVVATYYAATGDLQGAAFFICLGIFLDFFDGMAARLLGVASPLGKELDSLADVVTSGVASGMILLEVLGASQLPWLRWIGLLVPLFAAYRLAKFNLDTRQSHSFIGLPVPANALIWVGVALFLAPDCPHPQCWVEGGGGWNPLVENNLFIVALIVVSLVTDVLMVSEVPMFSLKVDFKDLSWRTNRVQYIFLIGCVVLAVLGFVFTLDWLVLPLAILWYIVLSLVTQNSHHAE